MNRSQKVQAIQERMRSDSGFAEQVRTDPKAVLEREWGTQLPDDFSRQTLEHAYPGFFELEEVKLSEEQMDKIAGGAGKPPGCVPCFG